MVRRPSYEDAPGCHGAYWPVPVTLTVCKDGVAESVTVTAEARVPTSLGVKVTIKVHCAFEARVDPQGVVPPGAAAYSPLPVMVALTEVARLLVIVTVCAALVVATVCAVKVSVVGKNVSGKAEVPLASSICWLMAAVSVMTTAPLMFPLEPSAGEKVTLSVQVADAARTRLAVQGVVPVPVAEKSPLVAMVLSVKELALLFLTVREFEALVVPTA